jgi:site-specific recombinase XerD
LREGRPAGFPLLFSADLKLIEPAVAFLHEHAVQRAHTADTVRTYSEILYDWFDALEQSDVLWSEVDTADLIAYRNRMLQQPSADTGHPYSVRTINHRVRGVLRFYQWAVRNQWLRDSPLVGRASDFALARRARAKRRRYGDDSDHHVFVLRQFEQLPRPFTSAQARELLAELAPPYDLMARWQLYTGLRNSELLRLCVKDVLVPEAARRSASAAGYRVIDVLRKGRKSGYVIASMSLLEETAAYLAQYRHAWLRRAARKRGAPARSALFINRRGTPVKRSTYQQAVQRAGQACGFRAMPHLLRAGNSRRTCVAGRATLAIAKLPRCCANLNSGCDVGCGRCNGCIGSTDHGGTRSCKSAECGRSGPRKRPLALTDRGDSHMPKP